MDPRSHLEAYVVRHGGKTLAAQKLGIPLSTLYSVLNGWRGVSPKQAENWAVRSGGDLDAGKLVWIRPTRAAPAKTEAA
jgi:hypothetical protein